MSNPLVSIIIPVYNRENLILETLLSVVKQSYTNFECIIVDDGSTDNSINIINKFIVVDKRFKIFKRPKSRIKGANSCRNYGFEISTGMYINWFDSDDIMHQDFIKNKVTAFTNNLDCIVSKTCFFKDEISNILGKETRTNLTDNLLEDFITLKSSWYLPDPMWKKSFLIGKSLFSEELKKGQDRDFHTRMLVNYPKIKIIDDYLTFYRQHDKTISNNYSKEVIQSYFNALNQRIELILGTKPSNKLKFYLLKLQTKNYSYLYKNKNSVTAFLRVFKKLFVLDIKNLVWFLKFVFAIILFNIIGKGNFLLKG